MSHFKAEMHQILFWRWRRARRAEGAQSVPGSSSWI